MATLDDKLGTVADWGVEAPNASTAEIPPEGSFPVERYRLYRSLMNSGHIRAISRSAGATPEIRFLVWRAGFGGDTRHIVICWRDTAPANQVSDLDMTHEAQTQSKPVYKHIDGAWYAWTE